MPRRTKAPAAHRQESGVRLMWPGRRWRIESPEPPDASLVPRRAPEPFEATGDESIRLLHGDALDLTALLEAEGFSGKVDMVYVDPPYASDRDYVAEARLDGHAAGRVVRTKAFVDTWNARDGGLGAYLEMLAPRLDALAGLLAKTGTIWVHVDWRAAYLIRAILDEVLGRDAFVNEIVWRRAPNLGRQAASGQFGRTLDTIVVYGKPKAKLVPPTRLEPIEKSAIRRDAEGRPFTCAPRGDYTDASIAKLDAEGRVHRTETGQVYIKYFLEKDEASGKWCRARRIDALWTDILPLRHASASERTGYPTQKPLALLERIIACATRPGGLVVDAFAGSGTTAVAAHALGRRAFVADLSPLAMATARTRLLRAPGNAGLRMDRVPSMPEPLEAHDILVQTRCEEPQRSKITSASPATVNITLETPRDPLAWAIGTRDAEGTFVCEWHAERELGTRARSGAPEASRIVRKAVVPREKAAFVRVWSDDGRATTRAIGNT